MWETLISRPCPLPPSEERDKLLGNLVLAGIGVKEVEEFVTHEENKLRGTKMNFKLNLRSTSSQSRQEFQMNRK